MSAAPAALFLALSFVSQPTQLGWADHEQMLAIGDGKCGFTLTDIDQSLHAKKTLAMAKASVIDKDTEQSIAKVRH